MTDAERISKWDAVLKKHESKYGPLMAAPRAQPPMDFEEYLRRAKLDDAKQAEVAKLPWYNEPTLAEYRADFRAKLDAIGEEFPFPKP